MAKRVNFGFAANKSNRIHIYEGVSVIDGRIITKKFDNVPDAGEWWQSQPNRDMAAIYYVHTNGIRTALNLV